ncbi:hypothetical protein [Thalassotalea piscium]|uniref:Uncharacterized protein n=1 Tax=Thalassotalea piscium TaxID=1230533 RepID=A0A7X0NFA2_9GAMM|nr:hypothetical protein [Thalassotalea piscium]MBB6542211.1 hypothetical protein [Thalassotalea piscium]
MTTILALTLSAIFFSLILGVTASANAQTVTAEQALKEKHLYEKSFNQAQWQTWYETPTIKVSQRPAMFKDLYQSH